MAEDLKPLDPYKPETLSGNTTQQLLESLKWYQDQLTEYTSKPNMYGKGFELVMPERSAYTADVKEAMKNSKVTFKVCAMALKNNFRKAANNKDKLVSLDFGLTLTSFYPRLNTLRQVSEVVVQGWNHKTKEAITSKAQAGDEVSKMGGSKLGASISKEVFAKATAVVIDKPVFTEGEAAQIAKGKFNEMTVDFITGEGTAIGNTDLRAGEVVELKGLGTRFSGLYYITSSTHEVSAKGYRTRFNVERNATT